MDPVEEIRRLYYSTSKATLLRDLDRAIDLLKSIQSEEERERAAVYMDGLSQMRSEWGMKSQARRTRSTRRTRRSTSKTNKPS